VEKPKEPEKMSRRKFLKLAGAALGTAALGYYEGKYGFLKKTPEGEDSGQEAPDNVFDEQDTDRETYILPENIKQAGQILGPLEKIPVKINKETSKGIEEYWYRQYKSDDPRLVRSLESAYIQMQRYMPELEKIFAAEEVPTKYIYLAIPESHWDLEAKSHAAAVGPYQFIESTAKIFGLKVDHGIDERKDPRKSALACAKYLKDLYGRTGDWDVALSGYNGNFISKYLRRDMQKIFGKGYENFLRYLEWNINEVKKYILQANIWRHKVKKGSTLEGIEKFYGINRNEMKNIGAVERKKIGGKVKNVFKSDHQIEILMQVSENKRKIYSAVMRGIAENLNYPPKFNAVYRIINETGFQEKIRKIMGKEKEVMLARSR
jgi:hypothetical protein